MCSSLPTFPAERRQVENAGKTLELLKTRVVGRLMRLILLLWPKRRNESSNIRRRGELITKSISIVFIFRLIYVYIPKML